MIEGQITEKIYQGCATRYSDGKRKLIDFEKGERCSIPMSKAFWSENISTDCRFQTGSSTKKKQFIRGPFKVVK